MTPTFDSDAIVTDGIDTPGGPRIKRRAFVLAGSLALLSPLVLRQGGWLRGAGGRRPGPLDDLAAAGGPRLSVGYLVGSDSPGPAGALPLGTGKAVPALSLPRGDSGLIGGTARVRIHGLTPGFGAGHPAIAGVNVDALLPSPGARGADVGLAVDDLVPFYAWTMRSRPQLKMSNSTSFVAGVDDAPSLAFSLGVESHGATAPAPAATAVFTAGDDGGMARLRKGVYLLGLSPGAWDWPRALPAEHDPAWAEALSLVVSVDQA